MVVRTYRSLWLLTLGLFASDAGVGVIGFFLFVYGGFALAVWWLVRRFRFVVALRRDSDTPKPARWQWFIIPVCLLAGMIDSCGFVHSPVTEPKRWQEDSFAPIRNRWWRLNERF